VLAKARLQRSVRATSLPPPHDKRIVQSLNKLTQAISAMLGVDIPSTSIGALILGVVGRALDRQALPLWRFLAARNP
jgi:hypothetical protein